MSLCSKLLGKIPRSVGVVAKRNCGVECQPLQRYNAEERGEGLTRLRHVVDSAFIITAELSEEGACFRVLAVGNDDGEEVHFTRGNLAHNAKCLALLVQVRV